MRASILVLLVACVVISHASLAYQSEFQAFKAKYGKVYASASEESQRFKAFSDNMDLIEAHKQKNSTYTLGVTKFADLTFAEFLKQTVSTVGPKRPSNPAFLRTLPPFVGDLPTTVDWVARGAVTPIQNQGQCGSSPHFGAIVGVEGYHFIHEDKLLKLSEQQIVDCAGGSNYGCNGAFFEPLFDYIIANGSTLEADYPYQSGSGQNYPCRDKGKKPAAFIFGYSLIGNETELQIGLNYGPSPTAVVVDNGWQVYTGGVYDSPDCNTQPTHGIAVVAYGVDGTTPYWTLKNTWGEDWGEKGYIRMARGKNMCDLVQYAYAVV